MTCDFRSLDDVRLAMLAWSRASYLSDDGVIQCRDCVVISRIYGTPSRHGFVPMANHSGLYKPCAYHAEQVTTYEWIADLDPKVVQGFLLAQKDQAFDLEALRVLQGLRR